MIFQLNDIIIEFVVIETVPTFLFLERINLKDILIKIL